jgi:hypothetical protein
MSLDAVRHYYQVEQPKDPALHHVCLTMWGKVTGEITEEDCHLTPITAVMESGLCPSKWVGSVLEEHERLGMVSSWMFKDKTPPPERPSFYEPFMFELIQQIQAS